MGARNIAMLVLDDTDSFKKLLNGHPYDAASNLMEARDLCLAKSYQVILARSRDQQGKLMGPTLAHYSTVWGQNGVSFIGLQSEAVDWNGSKPDYLVREDQDLNSALQGLGYRK